MTPHIRDWSLRQKTPTTNQRPTPTARTPSCGPLTATAADGGVTSYSYTPTQATQSNSVGASSTAQVDGYGRSSRSETYNGQTTNPYYLTDTCYDANGNASFTSYTYQGAGLARPRSAPARATPLPTMSWATSPRWSAPTARRAPTPTWGAQPKPLTPTA